MKTAILAVLLVSLALLGCTERQEASPSIAVTATPSAMPMTEISNLATPSVLPSVPSPEPTSAPDSTGLGAIQADAYRKIEFLQENDTLYTDNGIRIRIKEFRPPHVGQLGVVFELRYPNGTMTEVVLGPVGSETTEKDTTYESQGIFLRLLDAMAKWQQPNQAEIVIGPLSASVLENSRLRINPVFFPETFSADAYRRVEFFQIGDRIQLDNGLILQLSDIGAIPGLRDYRPPAQFDILDRQGRKMERFFLYSERYLPTGEQAEYNQSIYLKLLDTNVDLGVNSSATFIVAPLSLVSPARITPDQP